MGLLGQGHDGASGRTGSPELPKKKAAALGRFHTTAQKALFRGRGGGATGALLGFLTAFVARALLGALSFCWRGCALVARTLVSGSATSLRERQASAEQQCKRDRK